MSFCRSSFILCSLLALIAGSALSQSAYAKEISKDVFKTLPASVLDQGIPSVDLALKALDGMDNLPVCAELPDTLNDILTPELSCPFRPGFESLCSTYIKADCSLGPTGERMLDLFDASYVTAGGTAGSLNHYFSDPPSDILKYCPKYFNMSFELRQKFWVYFFMQLASFEHACTTKNKMKNEPGKGIGAFQMEYKNSDRQSRRPRVCTDAQITESYGKGATIGDFEPNLRCAMAIIAVQVAEAGTTDGDRDKKHTYSNGKLFPQAPPDKNESYFAQLKRPNGDLATALKKFSACK